MKKHRLKNARVIITGASDGIGKELTVRLIQDFDCFVLGIARTKEKLEGVKSLLGEKSDNFSYICADVSDEQFWKSLAATLEHNETGFDVLINNAGIMPPFILARNYDEDLFNKTLSINLYGVYYATRHLLPIISRSDRASIINISSAAAFCPMAGTAAYSASKAAVKAFTEALSAEEKTVYVAYVCPGFTRTNLFRHTDNFMDSKLIASLCTPVEKLTKKIIKGIVKGKKRMIFGKDSHLIKFLHSIMPVKSAPLIFSVMRKSKDKAFAQMFPDENK